MHYKGKCAHCGERRWDVAFSPTFGYYLCDSCFTELNDEREQANVDACYSNGEQDF